MIQVWMIVLAIIVIGSITRTAYLAKYRSDEELTGFNLVLVIIAIISCVIMAITAVFFICNFLFPLIGPILTHQVFP